MINLICCLCMYEEPQGFTDEERADRELLTMIGGNLLCRTHRGYAQSPAHSRMLQEMRGLGRLRAETR